MMEDKIAGFAGTLSNLPGQTRIEFVFPEATYSIVGSCVVTTNAPPLTVYEMALYSQRDARWRDREFAGGMTFGQAGCYVACVAMVISRAGYIDDPPLVAGKMAAAGCFSGAYLAYPERIITCYPKILYAGALDWRNKPADLGRLKAELAKGPVICEVDFTPGGVLNQHFVVVERFTTDDADLEIADPWDGSRTRLMQRYALANWNVARALFGARLLRIADM